MRASRLILAAFFLLFAGLPALAASSADAPHVHLQLISTESSINTPAKIHAGLDFKLESGWHVYWKNPGDAGQPPKIDWTLPNGVKAEPLQFPAPKRLPLGPLMDFGYEDEVLFPVNLDVDSSVKPGSAVHIAAKISWLVCRETCIPGKANLDLDLPVSGSKPAGNSNEPLFQRFRAELPKPLPAPDKAGFVSTPDGFRLTLITGQRETTAAFFPSDTDTVDNPAPQKLTPTAKGFTLDLKKDANLTKPPTQISGVIELSGNRNYEIAAVQGTPVASAPAQTEPPLSKGTTNPANSGITPKPASSSNPANPASPATPASVTNSANPAYPANPATTSLARIIALAFMGGLILNLMPCVFPVLFIKGLSLINSGASERSKLRAHGLVYAAGILVSFWALVAALLALRTAGSHLGWGFQFQSPIFLSLMAGLLFFLGLSLAGQFEIGFSLTSAGGSLAAKQGYTGSFFTGVLAVIVATPCTAPFMGAAVGYALAQTAAVTFAVFTALALGLAAPYVILTLQPAWTRWLPRPGAWMEVLRQAVSIPIFGTVVWLAWVIAGAYGAAVLASLLTGFLLLAIAGWFLGRWPAKGWSAVLATFIALCFIGLTVYSAQTLVVAPQTVTAHEGDWQPWSAAVVESYHAQGRPVFVDFTAAWCLSCQVNERVALTQPAVRQAFADANVALLKADWTQHDDAIAQALEHLGRNGVPAYALYPPGQNGPTLLPEALTPGIVMDAVHSLPHPATQARLNPSNVQ